MTGWQTHASRVVYENPWLRLHEDDVTRPDGSPGTYGVVGVRHPAVFVVPVTAADEVVMVRLHRYPIGRESLEIPAGGTDAEEAEVAARRELLEESGYVARSWRDLGPIHSLNGLANAPGSVWLAQDLTSAGDGTGLAEEGISAVVLVPWAEVLDRIGAGEIHDAETLAALMRAAVALGRVV